MRSVFACLSVSFALVFNVEAAVQVTGTAQGVTLPPTCTLASAARLTIADGRYAFTCAEDGLNYQCTQSGTNATLFTTGSPNQTLTLACTNATATGLVVDALVSGQQRGDGAGNVCAAASNVAFRPDTREFSWTCGSYQGLCEVSAASSYDIANKRVTVICTAPAPTGAATASPSSVGTGAQTLIRVAVTPADPPGTNVAVVANLTAIGGSASQALADDGLNGDAVAGDLIFSYRATVALGTSAGAKTLPIVVSDTLAGSPRSSATSATVTVLASTNPSGSGSASPSSVLRGTSTLLSVSVTPGISPPSTLINVQATNSELFGADPLVLRDDGLGGDVVAGDSIYSRTVAIAADAPPGAHSVGVVIYDQQLRFGSATIPLTVQSPTNPTGVGAVNPSSISPLDATLVTVDVENGTSPTSTGIVATANLAALGGPASQALLDDGQNGDAVAGDGIYSALVTVPWGTPPGDKTVAYSISDAQGRGANGTLTATILEPTALTAFGAATPDNVLPDGATLLTVTVNPGTRPNSSGVTVTANLTAIGGSMTQAFLDDGQNGDALAGDGVYSYAAVVATLTPTDPVTLPVAVADTQGRTANATIALSIVGPDDLAAAGLATPRVVMGGDTTLLTVTVTPGDNPPSTLIMVAADLTAVGGSNTQAFVDDATNGDATAGDNVFSYLLTLPAAPTPGLYRLPAAATDNEARSAQTGITLDVKGDPLFQDGYD